MYSNPPCKPTAFVTAMQLGFYHRLRLLAPEFTDHAVLGLFCSPLYRALRKDRFFLQCLRIVNINKMKHGEIIPLQSVKQKKLLFL